MSKRAKGILSLLAICAMGAIWLEIRPPAKGQSQGVGDALTTLARINSKARALKKARASNANSADIERSVGELTDATFSGFGYGPERFQRSESMSDTLIHPYVDEVKGRLNRAEVAYQQGRHRGIPEEKVVLAINGLAKKLGAPEYAMTDKHEVRKLRAGMLFTTHDLVSKEKPKEAKNKGIGDGGSISSIMSPVEAAYVTTTLIVQKVVNKEFQLTTEEKAAQWAKKQRGERLGSSDKTTGIQPQTDRQKEMWGIATRGISAMSFTDHRDLVHRSLDILGIDR